MPVLRVHMNFPVESCIPALDSALAASGCAVLSAPPGAGKTVRVPLSLLDAPWLAGRKIVMLEPRRLAARRAAEFMSRLLDEKVGGTAGFRIRGQNAAGEATRIEVVTEGILTRMLLDRPGLDGVGLLIFDEFHERSLHADLGLALALDVRRYLRDDLRLLVMSATLDCAAAAALLGGAPVVTGEIQSFPVETRYNRFAAEKPLPCRAADAAVRALSAADGDILVFLPGMREMRGVEELLFEKSLPGVSVHLLHGDLPPAVQEAALAPAQPGRRKVILSTSIAETSLTIEGIRIVVDSGLARMARFDVRRGMSSLMTVPVSQAVADQRRGRAGRMAPGLCLRLWTEQEHERLPERPLPEMLHADLAHLALDLALWGAPSGEHLSFLDPPPPAHLARAQDLLKRLGAMNNDLSLTPHGRDMARLPIHPRFGHMILTARERGWGDAACGLAALLEERDRLSGAVKHDPDIRSRLDALRVGRGPAFERVLSQKRRLMEAAGVEGNDRGEAPSGLLLAWAYPDRVGRRRADRPGSFQLATGSSARMPAGTLSREEFIAVAEADAGAEEGRIDLAAPLDRRDFEAAFADQMTVTETVEWDSRGSRVLSRRQRWFGKMIVDETEWPADPGRIAAALIEGIRRTGLHCLPWDREAERFRARAQWAGGFLDGLPDYSDPGLLVELETWLLPHLGGMSRLEHLGRLRLAELLKSRLTARQDRDLDRLAPAHLPVPSGSRVALDYGPPGGPVLAVRLQELFGLAETPRISGGRVAVTLHLLSPAARPLAVTRDLGSFWKNTYPGLRRQMQARYPRHHWPEDPIAASPTKRTKRSGR